MEQTGVEPQEKFVWFCRDCATKGGLRGDDIEDIVTAESQHEFASKHCNGNVIVVKSKDFEESVINNMKNFTDWRS